MTTLKSSLITSGGGKVGPNHQTARANPNTDKHAGDGTFDAGPALGQTPGGTPAVGQWPLASRPGSPDLNKTITLLPTEQIRPRDTTRRRIEGYTTPDGILAGPAVPFIDSHVPLSAIGPKG